MIYIENTTDLQRMMIPVSVKDTSALGESYRFVLYNTINLTRPLEEYVRTGGDFNRDFSLDFAISGDLRLSDGGSFYIFNLSLYDALPTGSYEYAFIGGEKILSKGVAMVGEIKNNDEQYNKEIQYEQYGE